MLYEISNVNVVQIAQFAEVHTVLQSAADILPQIPGNQDVEQRRVEQRERMFVTSPHSLPLFTTLDIYMD